MVFLGSLSGSATEFPRSLRSLKGKKDHWTHVDAAGQVQTDPNQVGVSMEDIYTWTFKGCPLEVP